MFGLDIIPAEGLFTPPQDPAITGLTEQDMKFLGEPDSSTPAPHPHGRGFALPRPMFDPSGGNCDGLVLDNRYLAEGSGSSTSV